VKRHLALAASCLAVVAGTLLMVVPVSAAPATRIIDTGWWWRLQTGVLTPLPPPPNVEEGMLQVQGTPDEAQAIAAVSAELPDGHASPVLTLQVADGGDQGGAAAVLLACQAGSAWTGEFAGRWDSAPVVDCSTSVTGIRSEDGLSWTFPLGALQFEDRFNIILVPGQVEGAPDGAAGSSFTLVFERPTAADIATTEGAPPPADPPPVSPALTTPPPAADDGFVAAPPSGAGDVPVPPAPAATPALEPELQGSTFTAPEREASTAPELAAVATPEPRTLARILGALVVLVGLASAFGVWRTDLLAAPAATADAPVTGGLGRFARDRTGEPNPVS
jgi:hypothetical protein